MIDRLSKQIAQFPTQLFLLVIGALLFLPLIGNVHLFDWDEINFAESAREMLLTHNYRMVQINFQPFYEKPPLFIWLQALSMSYFGVNEFAARFPNAICGIVTMLVVFNVGRNVFKSQFGVLWALLFACSFLPQMYFRLGIIDPVFNLFIFLGIFFLFKVSDFNDFETHKARKRNARLHLILSAVFIGLATLTKGPVAILLVVLTGTTYFVIHRGKMKLEASHIITWWVVVSLVIMAWLGIEVRHSGVAFIDQFIRYQVRLFSTEDAGHGGFFLYHFPVLLFGVFPASALIFDAFKKNPHDDSTQLLFKRWMIYLLCVVLIVFSIVKTKIVHYSSLCYFPITFLAAYYLNYLFEGKMKWTWRQTVPLVALCIIIAGAVIGGIFVMQHPDLASYIVKDQFGQECLKTKVYWSNGEIRFAIAYLVLMLSAPVLIKNGYTKVGVYVILISSGLFINKVMTIVVPRAEKYAQGALIEFLESKKNTNSVVETSWFKSYANYFYTAKPVPSAADSLKERFVVTRINKADEVKAYHPELKELYRKNGWVFMKAE